MSKRETLKSALSSVGFTCLRWRLLRPGLYCLNFHRITDPADCPFDRHVVSCTPDRFRANLLLLRARFEVINLARLNSIVNDGVRPGRRPLAFLTFDDGYADNYQHAFPALRELGLTACFFIPTSYIDTPQLPWWDEIAWLARNATVDRLSLGRGAPTLNLNPGVREQTILQLLVIGRTWPKMSEFLDVLREACRPSKSTEGMAQGLFMTWPELLEMRRAGMDIGSHTHTHTILSHLDAENQRKELVTSKEILENRLGETIDSISYPVGLAEHFTPETMRIAEEVGYRLGFSFIRGSVALPVASPLAIPRMNAGGPDLKASICYPWYHGN